MKKILILFLCFFAIGVFADTYFVIVDVNNKDYQSQKNVYDGAFTNVFIDAKATWRLVGRIESISLTNDIRWYQLPAKLTGVNIVLLNGISSSQTITPGFTLVEVKTDAQPIGTNILIKIKRTVK